MPLPTPTILAEGLRIGRACRLRKKNGWKRYPGDWKEICNGIVKDCWNGEFFQASAGHFRQFYARDFGWCIERLMKAGYTEECRKTLRYALERYMKAGRITTCITPGGRAFDYPDVYSPDSVAYLLRSLLLLGDRGLIEEYHPFLDWECGVFLGTAVEENTGLAKRKAHFSGMKDYAIRDGSCYDSAMIAMMVDTLNKLRKKGIYFVEDNLDFMNEYDLPAGLVRSYWNRDHFIDDLSGPDFVSGDANVYPFLLGVVKDQTKLRKAIDSIKRSGLQNPFPLRYEPDGVQTNQVWWERLVPQWERTAHWAHLGLSYIDLLGMSGRAEDRAEHKRAIKGYRELIERHGTLFECYTPDGEPYRSRWYHADEGMSWAVKML